MVTVKTMIARMEQSPLRIVVKCCMICTVKGFEEYIMIFEKHVDWRVLVNCNLKGQTALETVQAGSLRDIRCPSATINVGTSLTNWLAGWICC